MLNFIHNRDDQLQPQRTIRKKPQIAFGISLQTPQQFQKPWTMINPNTFMNPYLTFQKKRKESIPYQKLNSIEPHWTKKTDISQIQEMKILGNFANRNQNQRSRYIESYYQELKRSQTRFRLTKGQFTNFLQRNSKYQSIGPLQGQQRNMDKALQTKRSILQKSQQSIINSLNHESLGRLSKNQRKQPIQQKVRIRRNRQLLYKEYRNSLQSRKYQKASYFLLPQISSNIGKHTIRKELDSKTIEKA